MKTVAQEYERFSRSQFLYEGEAYQAFLEAALRLVDSKYGYFHVYNNSLEEIALTVWSKKVISQCTTSHEGHYPLYKAGIWADAIRNRKAIIHNDYQTAPEKKGMPDGHFVLTRHLGYPIQWDGVTAAVLGAGNRSTAYDESDVNTIDEFVKLAYPHLLRQLHEITLRRESKDYQLHNGDVKELLISMVSTLIEASSLRDQYTSAHEEQVSKISVAIGKRRGLSDHELLGIRLGALVHDIGKMAIPSEILNKSGPLMPAEMQLIRIHPEMGGKIFSHLKTPWPIVEMIEQHHERMDGSGYPKGLRNEQITLEARIIAVADVFNSMSTDRPYRFAPGPMAAIEEIKSGRGSKFDPYVVDAFLQAWKEEGNIWPEAK